MIDENQNEYVNNTGEQNQNTNYSNNSQNNNKVNSELLKHLEIIDNENCQLREALTELQVDLKQKDSSIEESNKIITKLKDEYTKLIKEYQNLENINNELLVEVKHSQNIVNGYNKQNNSINNLQQKNINLTNDINKIKNENIEMKNKILSMNEISCKNEEEIKNKELIVKDLISREKNLVEMVKDRENLISQQDKKIVELNDIITQKDEQLRVLVNFSKEINKENKYNVKEITRQACDTIKLFNHNNKINSPQNKNMNFLTDDNKLLLKNDKTTFADFIPLLKQNKTSFALKDAINSILFIPKDIDNKVISKEFLMDMNFKTELLKSELFASLIRETKFINFLDDLLDKLNLNSENNKIAKNIGNIQSKLNLIINKLKDVLKENETLKLQKLKLLQNQEDNNLYIKKIKESVAKGLKKIRDRYQNIGNNNNYNYPVRKKSKNKNKVPIEKDYGFDSTKDFDSNYDKNDYYGNFDSNKNINGINKRVLPEDNQYNKNDYLDYKNFSDGENRINNAKKKDPENKNKLNLENNRFDNNNAGHNNFGRNNYSKNSYTYEKYSTNNYDQNNFGNNYYNGNNQYYNSMNRGYADGVNRSKYNDNYDDNMMKSDSYTYFWNENYKNNNRNFSGVCTPNLRKSTNKKDNNKFSCSSCSSCSFRK